MAQRTPLGWLVIAALVVALAVFVNVPVALLTLAFVSGAPLFTIMLGATVLGAASGVIHLPFGSEFDGNIAMIQHVGLGDQVETMSTIPLFIYAGYLLAESGTADRLVRFANALLGWMPGGLAIVTIGTCALFTVFTGASGVTIIALGGVLMPALVRQGYPDRFSMGLIAGTGSVGLLFPPALPLFIYGTVFGLSASKEMQAIWDTRRFLFAGIVPGLVLVGMLSAVAVTVAIRKRLPRQQFSARELAGSLVLALPELMIPFGVIIGLVKFGFSLPEIAALTVVYTVVLELGVSRLIPGWGKPLSPRVLWTTSREAIAMVGAIFIIIFASTALTDFMVNAEVPRKIVAWTQSNVESRIVFLLAINIILLVVGTVMDIFSAIVVVLPLIAPIAEKYGVDPYHLGVIFLLNLEVGYLHPPVGLNLFITSVKFRRPITEVMWATIPFLVTMIIALLTITYVPSLTEVSAAMSPYDPARSGRIQDLVATVHQAAEKLNVVSELDLVDKDGKPLPGKDGKPIHKRIADCDEVKDEIARGGCQQVFFDAKACRGKPDEAVCTHRAIASWVVKNLNASDDAESQVVVVTEVPLVGSDGAPVKDKAGAPIVMKLAGCDATSDVDSCRDLFLKVSNCKIYPPDDGTVDACTRDAISGWVDENPGLVEAP
ncbi:MAG TPA: TRAP transporter large permease [Kofleriaceae bacterium]|nr:TRAP transporter large permease [Kofleriaceae bacterium]